MKFKTEKKYITNKDKKNKFQYYYLGNVFEYFFCLLF